MRAPVIPSEPVRWECTISRERAVVAKRTGVGERATKAGGYHSAGASHPWRERHIQERASKEASTIAMERANIVERTNIVERASKPAQ